MNAILEILRSLTYISRNHTILECWLCTLLQWGYNPGAQYSLISNQPSSVRQK
jgi:hypothetical protein